MELWEGYYKINDKIFKILKDDLIENDDYFLSNKKIIEDDDGYKIFKYDEYNIYDGIVFENKSIYLTIDDETFYIGDVLDDDYRLLQNAKDSHLIFYPGEYKAVEYDEVIKDSIGNYFHLSILIKKEVL